MRRPRIRDRQQNTLTLLVGELSNEFLTRPAPVSLTPEEIGPAPVVDVVDGDTVDVWLRFVDIRVQERAVVLAYTN